MRSKVSVHMLLCMVPMCIVLRKGLILCIAEMKAMKEARGGDELEASMT